MWYVLVGVKKGNSQPAKGSDDGPRWSKQRRAEWLGGKFICKGRQERATPTGSIEFKLNVMHFSAHSIPCAIIPSTPKLYHAESRLEQL